MRWGVRWARGEVFGEEEGQRAESSVRADAPGGPLLHLAIAWRVGWTRTCTRVGVSIGSFTSTDGCIEEDKTVRWEEVEGHAPLELFFWDFKKIFRIACCIISFAKKTSHVN